jgi:hypothetical protein
MKAFATLLILVLLLGLALSAPAIGIGDSRAVVLAALGEPPGYVGTPSREILMYERGEVVLEGGTVISAALISEEEARARRLQREAEEAARLERERIRRAQLAEEGTEIRLRKLADTEFMNASATQRVAFWRQFKKVYPMVELGDEYAAALRERELELAAENAAYASQTRIRDLERRVAQAEADAARGYYRDDPVYVGSAVPVVYGGRYVSRVRRPIYVGGGAGCGHTHCKTVCLRGKRPKVTPYDSTAGYAFQRAKPSGKVRVRAGLSSSCGSGAGIKPLNSTVGYGFQRALPVASRPWRASSGSVIHRPVSRGGISAKACISF